MKTDMVGNEIPAEAVYAGTFDSLLIARDRVIELEKTGRVWVMDVALTRTFMLYVLS